MVEGTAAELAATLANGPTKAYAAVRTLLKAWSAGGVPAADAVMLDITMPLHATEDVTRGFINTADTVIDWRGQAVSATAHLGLLTGMPIMVA